MPSVITQSDTVTLDIAQNIATITFNRPGQMNAFNGQMALDLLAVSEQVLHDDSIRAVILRGAGPLFMAGGDIQHFQENLTSSPTGTRQMVRQLHSSILNLRALKVPLLAVTHGSVAGVGISFLATADLVLTAEETKFTLAYTNIGLSPDGGSTYWLPRLVGQRKAMELLLLPDVFGAQEALKHGLVNWVVPSDQLETEALRIAGRLAQGPTAAFTKCKQLLRQTWQASLEEQLESEAECFAESTATKDFSIGVTAFLKKQRPEFVGR